ncbi:hypothetical protein BT93_B0033 [Corymbia citriodora subsp. variegata]|nr:hypothetical protein BT93_B0033 [Corymbia citriodora subsp. variegata]
MKAKPTRMPSPFSFLFLLFLSLSHVSSAPQQQQQPIKTIVVLVLENRSFDHMLGWMKKTINPMINGVTGDECNPVSTNHSKPQSICFTDDAEFVDLDPGHSFEDVAQQVFGFEEIPSMSGFVEQVLPMSEDLSEIVMRGFSPESILTYTTRPTQPNRLFVYSATSHGSTSHIVRQLDVGYQQKTIFDPFYENGLDFGIYFQNIPSTLFYRNLRKLKYISKFHLYDFKFKRDARNGRLPSLTVIEPRFFDLEGLPANDDHPAHDIANGQKLVKEVYETLRASPQWNETLLIITYDEHGGFYDHVRTPYLDVPNPDGNTGPAPFFFKFDRLGVRVPTIMVSPWIKKGTLISSPTGPAPNSETFEHIVGELQSPRTDCPETLPNVTPLRSSEANENGGLSEFQSEIVQLAAVLNGDHFLTSFRDEMSKNMSVKEAHDYVKGAVSRFIRASKEAVRMGANGSAIVDMRSSLTTRSSIRN